MKRRKDEVSPLETSKNPWIYFRIRGFVFYWPFIDRFSPYSVL